MIDTCVAEACAAVGKTHAASTAAAARDCRDMSSWDVGTVLRDRRDTVATTEFRYSVSHLADAPVFTRPPHGEAGPGRCRGPLAQADGARGPGPPGRRRPVVVAAGGLARARERRADRARGDGRDRLPRDAHAGHHARRAVEALRS